MQTNIATLSEKLSALIDGELTQADVKATLDAVLNSEALQNIWRDYHLIGDVLRAKRFSAEKNNI